MKAVFADTAFYVALANERDPYHAKALELARTRRGRVVTTEYVLIEVGNLLSRTGDRPSFLSPLEQIESDAEITVVPGTHDWFGRGVDLYKRRPDKQWSMTDCISFVVMKEMGLTEALTADRHFEQAEFTVLLM